MPKFDSVMVAPRSSSGGIERAAASARMRSRPARRSWASRSPILRSTGTMSPPSISTAMPRSMRPMSRRSPAAELYQALSEGCCLHAAAMARTRRMVGSSPLRQSLMSASSVTVVRTTSEWAAAIRCAMARRMPRSGSPGPTSARLRAARLTSARLKDCSVPRRRGRSGALRRRSLDLLAPELADDGAGVLARALRKFHQRSANLDQVALASKQVRNAAAPGRGYFDNRLVGFNRNERRIGDHVVALVDVPRHDLGFFETFAEIRQCELTHGVSASKKLSRTDRARAQPP